MKIKELKGRSKKWKFRNIWRVKKIY